ncbi:MAG: SUMF1/EgtB/PvdO family nonheme iron enzyme [Leptospirales bacterium]|nr:SUMF1/EgtB/PvdO family nonheme iron enzyme [Leptospirales bacterium]
MKKNFFKIIGLITIIAFLSFACGGDSDNGDVAIPRAPTGVTAVVNSSSSISVSWSSVSGATNYKVYYETYSGVTSARSLAGSVSGTSYTHNGLTASTHYYYYIVAVNSAGGESGYSGYADAYTLSAGYNGDNLIPLTAGTWANDEITSSMDPKEVWYSFDVVSGTKYYIWWNDSKQGYGDKSSNITVNAQYSNGRSIFTIDNGWASTISFTADRTGMVRLKVYGDTGTYGITYSTINSRPSLNSSGGSVPVEIDMVEIDMVWIPAGTFQMGQNGVATPVHRVTLTTGFYMGKYQVTQEQYEAVMGLNPSYFHGGSGREPATGEDQRKRPVEYVAWYNAIVFCNKLSMMEGFTPAYSMRISDVASSTYFERSTDPEDWGMVPPEYNNSRWDDVEIVSGSTGYRLPTEAQWEYACRAGTTTAYYTGDTIDDMTGWYSRNSNYMTHQVGLKAVNGFGLYDMHGNVQEWCWDWYDSYSSGSQTDPMGAALRSSSSYPRRVVRGGCWQYDASDMRSAYRYYYYPASGRSDVGFRVVRP